MKSSKLVSASRLAIAVALCLLCATNVRAEIIFHTSGQADFLTHVPANSHLGTEDFEGATFALTPYLIFDDPLTEADLQTICPGGGSAPITIQSNTLANPSAPSPRGSNALALFISTALDPPLASDTLFVIDGHALDIMPQVQTTAVGLSITNNSTSMSAIVAEVYGPGETLLDTTILLHDPAQGNSYLGIQATAGEFVTRINLDHNGVSIGVDHISLYQGGRIFLNDSAGFAAAVSGLRSLGTEDFEGSTVPGATAIAFDDALTQGQANGPMPTGVSIPVRIQSNTSGDPAAMSPRGQWGLALAEAGFAGLSSAGVVANYADDGLDIIMLDPTIVAASFNAIGYTSGHAVDALFYDAAGELLTKVSLDSSITGGDLLGYVANDGEFISRIRIVSPGALQQGVDNLTIYSHVPEPATVAVMLLGLAGVIRRRRR